MLAFASPRRLALTSIRHPWRMLAAWLLLLVVAGAFGSRIGSVLTTGFNVYDPFEAERGQQLIDQHFGESPGQEFIVIKADAQTVDSPAFTTLAQRLIANLRALDGDVAHVVSYYETQDGTLLSAGRDVLLIPVVLAGELADANEHAESLVQLVREAGATPGFTVATGGDGSLGLTFVETSERDLRTAEVVGLPIALVILVIVFGALAAAGLPIVLAIAGIVAAIGVTTVVGIQFELSFFVLNMITMIGLAVGLDYSLLIIQRFREELRNGLSRDAAIERSAATAARAVLFSGLAVMVALSGMLIIPDSVFRSLATGAIIVVVTTIAASMTLLPAILRLLGSRVNAGTLRVPFRPRRQREPGRFWNAVTGFVMRHAVLSVVITTGLLAAAAVPYLGINLGQVGVATLPADSSPRQAFEILDEEFSAGVLAPADIVITGNAADPAIRQGIDRLRALLLTDPHFGPLTVDVAPGGALTVASTPIAGDPDGELAQDAIRRLRGDYLPAAFAGADASLAVTGQAAYTLDYAATLTAYTPFVFALVLGLSFVILLVVFRSIVVPIKAIIMNLLSVGAAYGLMVLVFQHGVGASLLGFQAVDRIEAWVPLFMFSVLFGLSMDYHVFLLSRIRERFNETHDNRESVAHGVRTTAGLITGAAAIMVAVFAGFAMGELVAFQQMGFGLAIAILIDATVIRTVLVPASMALLGDANWYLPGWLRWLPSVGVEGQHTAQPATGKTPVPAGAKA